MPVVRIRIAGEAQPVPFTIDDLSTTTVAELKHLVAQHASSSHSGRGVFGEERPMPHIRLIFRGVQLVDRNTLQMSHVHSDDQLHALVSWGVQSKSAPDRATHRQQPQDLQGIASLGQATRAATSREGGGAGSTRWAARPITALPSAQPPVTAVGAVAMGNVRAAGQGQGTSRNGDAGVLAAANASAEDPLGEAALGVDRLGATRGSYVISRMIGDLSDTVTPPTSLGTRRAPDDRSEVRTAGALAEVLHAGGALSSDSAESRGDRSLDEQLQEWASRQSSIVLLSLGILLGIFVGPIALVPPINGRFACGVVIGVLLNIVCSLFLPMPSLISFAFRY